jgi:hypothetical protein
MKIRYISNNHIFKELWRHLSGNSVKEHEDLRVRKAGLGEKN